MKKKAIFSIMIILLAVAAIGGATMAWFTDTAEVENIFTAGTVKISVMETMTKITKEPSTAMVVESSTDASILLGEAATIAFVNTVSNPTVVYWDGEKGVDSKKFNLSDENRDPQKGWIHWVYQTKGESYNAMLTLQGTGNGSVYMPGPPPEANTWHFFTSYYDLDGLIAFISYEGVSGPPGQLVISDYCPGKKNGDHDNWNPGDCFKKDFWVNNEGSKRANVRVKVVGAWYEYVGGEWVVWPEGDINLVKISLHDESHNWSKMGDYWYFEDVAEEGKPWQARLVLKVCLDGKNARNDYQGKRFILTSYFEAIQASNEASVDAWGGWSAPEGKGILPPR